MEAAGDTEEIDFDIEREVWSRYTLTDETVLKLRTVLMKVFKAMEESGESYGLEAKNLVSTLVPPDLKGTPNPNPLSVQELRDLPHERVNILQQEEDWNLYRFSDGRTFRMRSIVVDIFRVDGNYDKYGNTQYIVTSQMTVEPWRTANTGVEP